jgi:hypothetical protein
MTNNALVDRYSQWILGTFSFKHMILWAPNKGAWVRISSRREFIEEAHKLGWTVADSINGFETTSGHL